MVGVLSPRLVSVLAKEVGPARGALGGGDAQERTQSLKRRLFVEASNSNKMYGVALAMVLAIFVLMLYLLTVYAGNTTVFLAISGASGVSLSGLIWFAVRVARESSQMGLLIALAEQLSSENALAAMQAILQQQGTLPTGNPTQK